MSSEKYETELFIIINNINKNNKLELEVNFPNNINYSTPLECAIIDIAVPNILQPNLDLFFVANLMRERDIHLRIIEKKFKVDSSLIYDPNLLRQRVEEIKWLAFDWYEESLGEFHQFSMPELELKIVKKEEGDPFWNPGTYYYFFSSMIIYEEPDPHKSWYKPVIEENSDDKKTKEKIYLWFTYSEDLFNFLEIRDRVFIYQKSLFPIEYFNSHKYPTINLANLSGTITRMKTYIRPDTLYLYCNNITDKIFDNHKNRILNVIKIDSESTVSTSIISFESKIFNPLSYYDLETLKFTLRDSNNSIPMYINGCFSITVLIRPRRAIKSFVI